MALYEGLSPKEALAKWYAIRQKSQDQLTPEERADVAGNFTGLQRENPQAWQAVKMGVNAQGNPSQYKAGQTTSVFDPTTGTYTDKTLKSWISDPESKWILAAAAGLGGVAAAPAIAGAFSGSGAAAGPGAGAASASGAGVLPSTTIGTGMVGPITGGTGLATGGSTLAGGLPAWLKAVEAGGQIASDISAGRAKGRIDESNLNNNADRTALDLYRTQVASNADENNYGLSSAQMANNYGLNSVNAGLGIGNLDLNQKEYALAAPGKRAGNAVRGDILANAQDVSIDAPNIPKTSISGGLRPSMFSANTRELGGLMSQQALDQQRAGDHFAPLPTVPAFQAPPAYKPPPAPPTLHGPTQANGVDATLNGVGYAGLGADLLAKYGKYFGL